MSIFFKHIFLCFSYNYFVNFRTICKKSKYYRVSNLQKCKFFNNEFKFYELICSKIFLLIIDLINVIGLNSTFDLELCYLVLTSSH